MTIGQEPTNPIQYDGPVYVPYPIDGIKDEHSSLQPTIGVPRPDKEEFQDNDEQRCAIVLVLDKSNSMTIDGRANLLNQAVAKFKSNLMEAPAVARKIDVAVIEFNHAVSYYQFQNAATWPPNVIQPEGGTYLSFALNVAMDMVRQRKDDYRMNGVSYHRPWILLLTDGKPELDSEYELEQVGIRVREGDANKNFNMFVVTCGEANENAIGILRDKIAPVGRPPKKTTEANFIEMFNWLSNSMAAVSRSLPGDTIHLEDTSGWEVA